ncbi:hypothetical protein BKA61DRAFT_564239 [Leptodontidium sp. MPI-SDFR-AT-0119]|nr:hypothetical protein BKA61DRAFT_564239 [Leptodontidium sp. MPI-SDFR-AT-0119]
MPYRGHNTLHGYDAGPPPPNSSGFSIPQYPGMPGYIQPPAAVYQPPMPYMQPMMPGYPYNTTHPSIPPLSDHGFPGVQLQNHLGGIGVPPGYNYIFPVEHTIIHVLKNATKPWQNDQTIHGIDPSTHTKFYVPVEMNVKEFMKRIGCDNADEKKNVVYEVVEKGNGKWAQGLKVNMDDKDKMKLPLGKFGWNKQRNGNLRAGGRPIVWLWREKGE